MLPALMHRISAAFALGSCSFRVEKERESTARVTVWRHLGVTRSYTMEASFCGFDKGPFKVTTPKQQISHYYKCLSSLSQPFMRA